MREDFECVEMNGRRTAARNLRSLDPERLYQREGAEVVQKGEQRGHGPGSSSLAWQLAASSLVKLGKLICE